MAAPPRDPVARIRAHLTEPQHRDALFLTLNTLTLAAAGLLFWLVVTRVVGLSDPQVGRGLAIVALATAIAVVAKGGLDTALVRHAPRAGRREATRLLWGSIAFGVALALTLTAILALAARAIDLLPHFGAPGWALVAAISALLLVTWLQDACFVSEREARRTLQRNLAASGARVALPFALVALALPHTVALAWALALAFGATLGIVLGLRLSPRAGAPVAPRAFAASATRNVAASAAEFLPGLLLAPLVLAIDGPAAAAYFGIAWTAASLLFLVSSALSRSALVSFVRDPTHAHPRAVRRGVAQHLLLVLPAAALGALLAPFVMGVFGDAYAREGAAAFALLCASVVVVAPSSLYLAVLRARERVVPLVLLPLVTIAALLALAPPLADRWGLPGVALAWLLANAPFGAWSVWRLTHEARGVTSDAAAPLDRRAHLG